VLVALFLTACSDAIESTATTITTTTAEPITTTATAEATTTTMVPPALEEAVFDVAFDGTTCTVVGPTQVPAGVYSFFLTDSSSFGVEYAAIRAGDGHSYEDLVALQAAPGETFSLPPWASLAMFSFAPMSRDLADNEIRLVLDAGEYGISLLRPSPRERKWFCSGISVTEP
jgi:hypothetical protein